MNAETTTLQRAAVTPTDRVFTPRADLFVGADALRVEVDLPGVTAEGLTVEADAGHLRLEGRRGAGVVYRRVFRVPDGIDADAIVAELKHGVLTVTLPKAKSHVPRRIQVR